MNKKCLKIKYEINDNEFIVYSDEELKKDFTEFYDSDSRLAYSNISIKLVKTDFDDSFESEILRIDGILFDVEFMVNNGFNQFMVYDSIDGDTLELYETFYEDDMLKDEYYSMLSPNIFYLDRLYVNQEYRNKGYATIMLNKLADILKHVLKLNIGLICIYSQPFEIKGKMINNVDDKELAIKLHTLYEKCGYIPVNNTNYLYMKIE